VNLIRLTGWDLGLAVALVLLLAGLSLRLRLAVTRPLLVSTLRMGVQLALIGYVLKALVMLLVAGREVTARQKRRLKGAWGYGLGTGAMFVSSFAVTVLALAAIVRPEPWYDPRYAIPLLGMLLGNTMNGVALGLNALLSAAADRRDAIEQCLMLGQPYAEATADIRREAIHTGLIPIVNAMAAAGVVSLPGMMTGQILAGAAPLEAVKYQVLIMLLIAAGAGFGLLAAVGGATRRLFDERERLRLDRLN
jgi:putative ABC transport system permease protein